MITQDTTRKQIGIRLKKCRQHRCMNLYQAAKKTGLSIGQLKKLELGNDNYTIDILFKAANYYKLKIRVDSID